MATLPRSNRVRRRKQKVPNLVGLSLDDARLVLRHRGFADANLFGTPREGEPAVDVRYVKDFAPYGTVVSQDPARGQICDSTDVVTLTVSMESLLDYLPAIYRRRDVAGSNFIAEFLWIFQHVFYSIESKIENMSRYFEVFETPEEFLPWLASWVAFTLDGDWDEAQRRLFLKRAVELYRIRGTVRGLRTFLKMYTGVEAKIIENAWPLEGFRIGVASTIGRDSAILPPINRAHCFIVEVPLDATEVEDDQIIKIHQILTQEKPAHTTYYLRFTGRPKEQKRWAGPVIGFYRVTSAEVLRGTEAEEAASRAEPSAVIPGASSMLSAEIAEAAARDARAARGEVVDAPTTRRSRRRAEGGEGAEAASAPEAEAPSVEPGGGAPEAAAEAGGERTDRAAARAARREEMRRKALEEAARARAAAGLDTAAEADAEASASLSTRASRRAAAQEPAASAEASTEVSGDYSATLSGEFSATLSGDLTDEERRARREARRARIRAAMKEDVQPDSEAGGGAGQDGGDAGAASGSPAEGAATGDGGSRGQDSDETKE
jgi:phage tail-like protein